MNIALLFQYTIYLISERILQTDSFSKKKINIALYFIISIIFILLIFKITFQIFFFISIIFLRMVAHLIINKDRKLTTNLWVVPIILIILSFTSSNLPVFSQFITRLWEYIGTKSFLFDKINSEGSLLLLSVIGILLVGFETNNFIRWTLIKFKMIQINKEEAIVTKEEVKRGYLIGVMERSLIFFMILLGKPESITLIIAAKAVYRYKSLEEKDFAEYVLLGTLLSLVLAVLVSYTLVNFLYHF
ncbi:MAG: hypothetical protein KAH95_00185 [Spirochaetales bacterium]|nr:hypothetical protein [Spirochaetales bacterium]